MLIYYTVQKTILGDDIMNIAICDDDWSAVCTIKKFVDLYMSERVIETNVFTFVSGKELLDTHIRFDIVFLDIEMPGLNGLEIHKKLKERYMDTIDVFITSHETYIDDALRLLPYGFIQKPVEKERFFKVLAGLIEEYTNQDEEIAVRTNDGIIKIKKSHIVYAAIERRKVVIQTIETCIEANEPFAYWKETLKDKLFFQVHQSYIVNMQYVKSITKTTATMSYINCTKGTSETFDIYVSSRKSATFRKIYFDYIGGMKK